MMTGNFDFTSRYLSVCWILYELYLYKLYLRARTHRIAKHKR